jgi:hypothetical protein
MTDAARDDLIASIIPAGTQTEGKDFPEKANRYDLPLSWNYGY